MLLHASLRQGDRRFPNGSTGTVTDVTPRGLKVRLDDGEVRRFEVEHENRRSVLRVIDARINSIVSVRRSLSGAT